MNPIVAGELGDWAVADLLDAARTLAGELTVRLTDPSLVDAVPRFPDPVRRHPADDWALYADDVTEEEPAGLSIDEIYAQAPAEEPLPRGTFPELHAGVEELSRVVEASRTALAGHVGRMFDAHSTRQEVLGIPEGKCAYRNAAEYLRERLRLPRRQARILLERAEHLTTTRTLDRTHRRPPRLPVLADTAAAGDLDPAAVDAIITTLTGARDRAAEVALRTPRAQWPQGHPADDETAGPGAADGEVTATEGSPTWGGGRVDGAAGVEPDVVERFLSDGERLLVSSARDMDPDALAKVCAHWQAQFATTVDPDGTEPSEARRRAHQGLFYRGRKDGLHRWTLVAAQNQHEILNTITSAASNIRSEGRRGREPAEEAARSEAGMDTGTDGAPSATGPASEADTGTVVTKDVRDAAPDAVGETGHAAGRGSDLADCLEQADHIAPDADSGTASEEESTTQQEHAETGEAESGDVLTEEDIAASLEGDQESGGFRDFESPGLLWARQVQMMKDVQAAEAAERAADIAAAAAATIMGADITAQQNTGPGDAGSGSVACAEPFPNEAASGPPDGPQRGGLFGWDAQAVDTDALEGRSRAQRELDGLISALTGALALTTTAEQPDGSGGARPQVLVTIDYQSLFEHTVRPASELPRERRRRPTVCPEPCCDSSLEAAPWTGDESSPADGMDPPRAPQPPAPQQPPPQPSLPLHLVQGSVPRGERISSAAFTGPINPATIRAWACDAELIPVVLGGDGEVLDVGRAQRLFTRKQRRALTARDGGCAAPGCTIPAPWCEAHHIDHWEHGGTTSIDNGVLLCSHHHHAVHAGAWTISMRNGIPWFIPAAYHDPDRRPRRNHTWRPWRAA